MDSVAPLLYIGFASGLFLIVFFLLLEGARHREPVVDLAVAFMVSIWAVFAFLLIWVIIGEQVLGALEDLLKSGITLLALPVVIGIALLIVFLTFVILFEMRSRAILQILEEVQRKDKDGDKRPEST